MAASSLILFFNFLELFTFKLALLHLYFTILFCQLSVVYIIFIKMFLVILCTYCEMGEKKYYILLIIKFMPSGLISLKIDLKANLTVVVFID